VDFISIEQLKTELKAARKKEERTRLMFDSAPIIIQYWNEYGVAIDCNQTTLDFYGYKDKNEYFQNFGQSLPKLQPNGEKSWDKWNNFLSDVFHDGAGQLDFMETDLEGKPAFFEVIGLRTEHNDSPSVLTYSTDVTKAREALDEMHKREVAEQASMAKSRFLARMSHEIRTPITAILGISEIKLRSEGNPPDVQEAFVKILNSSNSLIHIVNDILDLSRIEAGKLTLSEKEYDINSLIVNVIHINTQKQNNVKFELYVDENLPVSLAGDPVRIEQIVNNLLSNAFRYTQKGSVGLCVKSRECELEGYITLEIAVSDTGIGMTDEQIEAIFQEYARFHESEVQGIGLGMPIVNSLARIMDAEISIKSQVGEGTTVTVCIPQKVMSVGVIGKDVALSMENFEIEAQSPVLNYDFEPESMPYGRVLVVDDVEANIFVMKGLLGFYDLEVDSCENGFLAIDKIKVGEVYDIIFMDHMMPGITGIETLNALRQLDYAHPVVALTANAMIGKDQEFTSKGFDGFISKPVSTGLLDETLKRLIRDKQSQKTIEDARAKGRAVKKININDYQDDAVLIRKIEQEFYAKYKNAYNEIVGCLEGGDFMGAQILAHTIKTMASILKEDVLAALASSIEDSLEDSDSPKESVMFAFEIRLADFIERIAPAPAAPSKNLEKLEQIIPLLEFQKAECLEHIGFFEDIPEAKILVRLVQKFDFATAYKSALALRDILS